jgi:predicted amidohydrolase
MTTTTTMPATTRVAVAQVPSVLGDVDANARTVLDTMRTAAADGVELIVFPECGLTGYAFDSIGECLAAAIPADGAVVRSVQALAEALGLTVVVGYLETSVSVPGAVHNTATLFAPGGIRADYRKVHLPFMCADRFATAGTQAPVVVDTPHGVIGLSICYDMRFPEWMRSLSVQGASIIVNPTNWAIAAERVPRILPAARALENAVYLLIADRGDEERGVEYYGRSSIVSPIGDTIATCDRGTHLLTADVDLSLARQDTIVFEPGTSEIHILSDRRPELYASITSPAQR